MKKYQMTYVNPKWLNDRKKCPNVTIPHGVVGAGLTKVILHGFADASKLAVPVAVYTLTPLHHFARICLWQSQG